MEKPEWYYRQSGAVPFRYKDGRLEVLLITTRKRGHWTIPKGIIEPDLTSRASALKESWEEAGVRGPLLPGRLGEYHQKKWGGVCRIEVFLLQVDMKASHWPEAWFRSRRWFSLGSAVDAVQNKALQTLLEEVAGCLAEQDGQAMSRPEKELNR